MGSAELSADSQTATRILKTLVLVATVGLLVPFERAVLATWTASARHSTASIFAFAAVVLIGFMRGAAIRRERPGSPGVAILALVLSTLTYVYAMVLDVWFVAGLGALGVLGSVLLLFHGPRGARAALPALLMGVFVIPPPHTVIEIVQTRMTLGLASLAARVLSVILGEPILASGSTLNLPVMPVPIIDDCSGLGGILIAPPFALLLLFLARVPFGLRWVVVAAVSMVLAALTNFVRIIVSALLVQGGYKDLVADGWVHELLGVGPMIAAGLLLWWIVHSLAARREVAA